MVSRRVRHIVLAFCTAGFSSMASAHTQPKYASSQEVPANRAVDSYAIYQQLLSDPAEQSTPITQWLIQDMTTAKALTEPCMGTAATDLAHAATIPDDRKIQWNELLTDYAAHCHERFVINAAFLLPLPVRLLDEKTQALYELGWQRSNVLQVNNVQPQPIPQYLQGGVCLHSFSAVYFNRSHTLAATYFMHCRTICGSSSREWIWVVLERTPTGWKSLPWVDVATGEGAS